MSEQHDLNIARDMGEMKADMRTVKHDLAGLMQSVSMLGEKMNSMSNQRAKGLGFFAGATFIIATFGGVLLFLGKLLFGAHP